MDKLNFLTAGMPLQTGNKGYKRALEILNDMDLDGLELEFVRGVRIKEENKEIVKNSSLVKTIHAPFYINLNSKEEEKIEASIQRIVETAKIASEIDAFSITYHAGFYLGMDKTIVFKNIKKQTEKIVEVLSKNDIYFGNENDSDIQSQPYIIIKKRMPVLTLQEYARDNGVICDEKSWI